MNWTSKNRIFNKGQSMVFEVKEKQMDKGCACDGQGIE